MAGTARLREQRGRARTTGRIRPGHPTHLWAGTVQDGTALGFAAALEEAVSLAAPEPAPSLPDDPARTVCLEGKTLRRKKDLLPGSLRKAPAT